MAAGSVLFWLGGTLLGGGANTTADDWRYDHFDLQPQVAAAGGESAFIHSASGRCIT